MQLGCIKFIVILGILTDEGFTFTTGGRYWQCSNNNSKGKRANPSSCKTYMQCKIRFPKKYFMKQMSCPRGRVFDEVNSECFAPDKVHPNSKCAPHPPIDSVSIFNPFETVRRKPELKTSANSIFAGNPSVKQNGSRSNSNGKKPKKWVMITLPPLVHPDTKKYFSHTTHKSDVGVVASHEFMPRHAYTTWPQTSKPSVFDTRPVTKFHQITKKPEQIRGSETKPSDKKTSSQKMNPKLPVENELNGSIPSLDDFANLQLNEDTTTTDRNSEQSKHIDRALPVITADGNGVTNPPSRKQHNAAVFTTLFTGQYKKGPTTPSSNATESKVIPESATEPSPSPSRKQNAKVVIPPNGHLNTKHTNDDQNGNLTPTHNKHGNLNSNHLNNTGTTHTKPDELKSPSLNHTAQNHVNENKPAKMTSTTKRQNNHVITTLFVGQYENGPTTPTAYATKSTVLLKPPTTIKPPSSTTKVSTPPPRTTEDTKLMTPSNGDLKMKRTTEVQNDLTPTPNKRRGTNSTHHNKTGANHTQPAELKSRPINRTAKNHVIENKPATAIVKMTSTTKRQNNHVVTTLFIGQNENGPTTPIAYATESTVPPKPSTTIKPSPSTTKASTPLPPTTEDAKLMTPSNDNLNGKRTPDDQNDNLTPTTPDKYDGLNSNNLDNMDTTEAQRNELMNHTTQNPVNEDEPASEVVNVSSTTQKVELPHEKKNGKHDKRTTMPTTRQNRLTTTSKPKKKLKTKHKRPNHEDSNQDDKKETSKIKRKNKDGSKKEKGKSENANPYAIDVLNSDPGASLINVDLSKPKLLGVAGLGLG